MDELGKKAIDLREVLSPMVALFVEQVAPKKDGISISQSYSIYGRKWIDSQMESGNLSSRFVGKKRVLSRAEIECLLAAQKDMPVFKQ